MGGGGVWEILICGVFLGKGVCVGGVVQGVGVGMVLGSWVYAFYIEGN